MKVASIRIPVLLALLVLGMSGMVQSQTQRADITQDRAAQYYLGSKDELLIPVNIWGFVMKPGQYLVPNNTDLISLLSFAGGPTENAKLNNVRIIRTDSRLGSRIYKVDVKMYVETGDERLIPPMKPGDTVIVKGSTYHWISRVFEFVTRLAVFAQIYYFIVLGESYSKK